MKIRGVNEGWIRLSRLPGEECEARKGLIAWKSEIKIRSNRVGLGMRRLRCRKWWSKS